MGAFALAWLAGTGLIVAGQDCTRATGPATRYEFAQVQMGTSFKIVLYAPEAETANRAAEAAFGRVKQLNDILSDYDADSELSKLSCTGGSGRDVPLGDDLWFVLCRAQRLSRRTGGAFDVTVGPYTTIWQRVRSLKQLPSAEELAAAGRSVGYRHLRLDPCRQTARLLRVDMRLDLGAIAKGYAADEALDVLRGHGITRALVDAGGDIAIGDPPPDRSGWRIGVAPLARGAPPHAPAGQHRGGHLRRYLAIRHDRGPPLLARHRPEDGPGPDDPRRRHGRRRRLHHRRQPRLGRRRPRPKTRPATDRRHLRRRRPVRPTRPRRSKNRRVAPVGPNCDRREWPMIKPQ